MNRILKLLAQRTGPLLITALVLSIVANSIALYATEKHIAMAGEQGWDAITNPGGTNVGAIASPIIANDGTIFVTLTASNSLTWSTDGGITFRATGVAPSGGNAVITSGPRQTQT